MVVSTEYLHSSALTESFPVILALQVRAHVETSSERLSHLPKDTQLLSGPARMNLGLTVTPESNAPLFLAPLEARAHFWPYLTTLPLGESQKRKLGCILGILPTPFPNPPHIFLVRAELALVVFSSWNVSAQGPPRPAPHLTKETKAYKEKVTSPESHHKIRSPVSAH